MSPVRKPTRWAAMNAIWCNVAGDEALTPNQQIALQQALGNNLSGTTFKYGNALMVNPFMVVNFLPRFVGDFVTLGADRSLTSVQLPQHVGPSAGVMALVALSTMSWLPFCFCNLQDPINESLVAVVLSILGFSINDTIVIYDRIVKMNGDRQRCRWRTWLTCRSTNPFRSINTCLLLLAP